MPAERTASRHVDKALEALDAGDLVEAEARLERARRADPELPELAMAEGDLASRRGDSDAALSAYARAIELAPGWVAPIVECAVEHLYGRDEPSEALARAEEALASSEAEDEDRARALLVAAAALVALERDDAAMERLEGLERVADAAGPGFAVEVAHLWLELGAAERAAAAYEEALDADAADADAWYGLGLARAALGDEEGAAEAWLRTRALDLSAPRAPFALTEEELEALAERTLRELPDEVRERLRDVPILVEDAPSEELVRDGVDPRLLGLFTGTPLPHKEHVGGAPLAPDAARLFLRNLESACADREELEEQLRITILHETAHFFGLEDEDLEELGLG